MRNIGNRQTTIQRMRMVKKLQHAHKHLARGNVINKHQSARTRTTTQA
ncbi:MAG: hypothetical protein WCP86_06375 [bacterium]